MRTFDIDENETNLDDLMKQLSEAGVDIENIEEPEDRQDNEDISEIDEIDLSNFDTNNFSNTEEMKTLVADLEELRTSYNDLESKYMRSVADFENFKRRTREESSNKIAQGKTKIIKELLLLQDSFERAISHSNEDKDFDNLFEGMNMLSKMLEVILVKENVKSIPSVGEIFNPEIHDCILVVNNPNAEAETILEETEKGFMMGNVVLRPAKVVVVAKK